MLSSDGNNGFTKSERSKTQGGGGIVHTYRYFNPLLFGWKKITHFL